MVKNLLSRDRQAAEPGDTVTEPRTVAADTEVVRTRLPTRRRDKVNERTTQEIVTEPVTDKPAVEAPPRHPRTSLFALLGLVIGLVALCATLTGLLAPFGIALGVIGGAVAAGGLVGASRRGVTGHSVALLGLACAVFAIVLGVLAVSGHLTWLDSKTDEVARLRDWLNAQLPWLKNW